MRQTTFDQLNVSEIKNYLILLDVDGTLVIDNGNFLNIAVKNKITELSRFNQIYLCTNKKAQRSLRSRAFAESAGVKFLDTPHRKPSKKILNFIDNPNKLPLLVIGDKVLTDGLFARRIGTQFIKVKRLSSKEDSYLTKIIYALDNLAAELFELMFKK